MDGLAGKAEMTLDAVVTFVKDDDDDVGDYDAEEERYL